MIEYLSFLICAFGTICPFLLIGLTFYLISKGIKKDFKKKEDVTYLNELFDFSHKE
jgi:hypothetical protein